jgi:hypothetical protein
MVGMRSSGKWLVRSHSAMCGDTSASANSRTTARKSSCSLLSSNTAYPSSAYLTFT